MPRAGEDPHPPAKSPVTRLAGGYGHPAHPALVSVPIGAWVASFLFDLGSYTVDEPAFLAHGSRWLIGLGVLGAVVAAMVGLLDLLTIPPRTRAFRLALIHLSLALGATTAYGIGFAIRGGDPAAPVPAAPLALSVIALAALGTAGFLGGTLAYTYGIRVADERTQARGLARPHDLQTPPLDPTYTKETP